jgi:hypothetical protein
MTFLYFREHSRHAIFAITLLFFASIGNASKQLNTLKSEGLQKAMVLPVNLVCSNTFNPDQSEIQNQLVKSSLPAVKISVEMVVKTLPSATIANGNQLNTSIIAVRQKIKLLDAKWGEFQKSFVVTNSSSRDAALIKEILAKQSALEIELNSIEAALSMAPETSQPDGTLGNQVATLKNWSEGILNAAKGLIDKDMALYALKRTGSDLLYAAFAYSELLLGLVKLGLTGVNFALNPFPNFRAPNRTDPSSKLTAERERLHLLLTAQYRALNHL